MKYSNVPGAGYAYAAVLAGVFVTAFYSFRMYFLVFHGEERFGKAHDDHGHARMMPTTHMATITVTTPTTATTMTRKSRTIITTVLHRAKAARVALGRYRAAAGAGDSVGDHRLHRHRPDALRRLLQGVIHVDAAAHPRWRRWPSTSTAPGARRPRLRPVPFWLALAGVVVSWFLHEAPGHPGSDQGTLRWAYTLLDNKYYFDKFNEAFFAGGARKLGAGLWKGGDVAVIDGLVNGSAKTVGWIASIVRFFQTGHIYSYAFSMIIGLVVLMTFWVVRA